MDLQDRKPKAGAVVFAAAFLVVSALLLSQIGEQTKFSARGKLFTQPRF